MIDSPHPIQSELLEIDSSVLLHEFQATFKNETAHMPEVSLRYLLYLIFSNSDPAELVAFAAQVRGDLNEQRFKRDAQLYSLTYPDINTGSSGAESARGSEA